MLRSTTSVLRRSTPGARVAYFSTVGDAGGAWKSREHAREEAYFNQINAEARKAFAEKLHSKELRELLAIIGEKHTLTQDQVHKLLEWKHDLN